MRKVTGRLRAGSRHLPHGAKHQPEPAARSRSVTSKAGGISLAVLAILFCLVFYQNLPLDLGLNSTSPQQSMGATASAGGGPGADQGGGGNTKDRIIKICMLVAGIAVIATNWSLARVLVKRVNVGFSAFMVLIPLSALWSIESSATMLRFVTLASIVLVCFAISLTGWHRQRFQQIALPPVMFILIGSLILGMLYPDRITELGDDLSQKGAWHGMTLTKNQFGMMASLAVIMCVNRLLTREGRAHWALAGAAIGTVCLLLSRSNTSMFAALVSVAFMVLVMRIPVIRQRYSAHIVIGIVAVLILYELVVLDVIPGAYTMLAPIRSLTGKDGSLSGRTVIWEIIKQHIQGAPWLGTGYGAYWLEKPDSPSAVFNWVMFFYPSESHNGYLEIVNDLGYLGLFFLAVFIISYVRQGIELLRIDRSQAALYLGLLFQQLVMNMSESEWFARDSIFTVIILGITCMGRALHEGRQQRRQSMVARATKVSGRPRAK